jgi:hypothetical protein
MKTITTPYIYYSPEGKFFVSEREWPKEPHDVRCHSTHACNCASMAFESGANRDVVDGYDDNCPYRYKEALSRCLSEAYEVTGTDLAFELYTGWDFKGFNKGTVLTLPEPREFEVKQVEVPCPDNIEGCEVLHLRLGAILLPKSVDAVGFSEEEIGVISVNPETGDLRISASVGIEEKEDWSWCTKEVGMKMTKPCVFPGKPSPETWVEWLKRRVDLKDAEWDYIKFALKDSEEQSQEELDNEAERFFNANYSGTAMSDYLKPYIINTYKAARKTPTP